MAEGTYAKMGKMNESNCEEPNDPRFFPFSIAIDCEADCPEMGDWLANYADGCLEGDGVCYYTWYYFACEWNGPTWGRCIFFSSLYWTDCKALPPEDADYSNDPARKVYYDYNLGGGIPPFWRNFHHKDNTPVFRYANRELAMNIKVKLDPTEFFP